MRVSSLLQPQSRPQRLFSLAQFARLPVVVAAASAAGAIPAIQRRCRPSTLGDPGHPTSPILSVQFGVGGQKCRAGGG
jgi:hypothetical protein